MCCFTSPRTLLITTPITATTYCRWPIVTRAMAEGAKLPWGSVAGALAGTGKGYSEIIRLMSTCGVASRFSELANALYSSTPATWSQVARALKEGLPDGYRTWKQVANTLWWAGIQDFSNMMSYMVNSGLELRYSELASALVSGAGASWFQAARALKEGALRTWSQVATSLEVAGKDFYQIMSYMAGSGLSFRYAELATALVSGTAAGWADAAAALRFGLGRSLTSVARNLYECFGGGTNYEPVLWAIKDGVGGYYWEMAEALYYGIEPITIPEVAVLVRRVGGLTLSQIASVLWDMNAGLTKSNIVYYLVNTFGAPVWEAWNIVNPFG